MARKKYLCHYCFTDEDGMVVHGRWITDYEPTSSNLSEIEAEIVHSMMTEYVMEDACVIGFQEIKD